MNAAIKVRGLTKTYPGKPPVHAVRGIDFDVAAGQCFGVLGPNGAGKTTTIEILEGLLPASGGDAEILGMKWATQAQQIRARIGVSLQETRLNERLTVLETIQLFRSFYSRGLTPMEALELVSLTDKAKSWVKNLSGGQKQRLAVATALVGQPDLIFLDEPTTGLDPSSRRQMWEIIENLIAAGKTILLTTHYMEEAERLCDRVAIFDQGTIIAEGSPSQLIQSLGADHVIEFSLETNANRFDAQQFATLPTVGRIEADNGQIRITAGQPHLVLPLLLGRLKESNYHLASLTTRHASLEDVFVTLTGRHLDD